ncbi:9291_t:CDS:2 [Entrophospora sp. SA101]|nr:9291_t:CDS:2 [Entrophospora sp. SA101]
MKLSQLQELAKKVQLEIKAEETQHLLNNFLKLEELLAKFRQVQLKNSQFYQKQAKLTLSNLQQLTKNYLTHKIKQEIVCHNATVSAKNFLIIQSVSRLSIRGITSEHKKGKEATELVINLKKRLNAQEKELADIEKELQQSIEKIPNFPALDTPLKENKIIDEPKHN